MVARNFRLSSSLGSVSQMGIPIQFGLLSSRSIRSICTSHQMPPDSIGQSVADQSFKFVGGHRRPFHGSPP